MSKPPERGKLLLFKTKVEVGRPEN